MLLNTWKDAYNYQQEVLGDYDNGFDYNGYNIGSGVSYIDELAFALKDVGIVWLIMEDGYGLEDYEEWATEIGITEDGKWTVLYDGHCSCYGWEATEKDVTYYDSLDLLLKAEPGAKILLDYEAELLRHFPFLNLKLKA